MKERPEGRDEAELANRSPAERHFSLTTADRLGKLHMSLWRGHAVLDEDPHACPRYDGADAALLNEEAGGIRAIEIGSSENETPEAMWQVPRT